MELNYAVSEMIKSFCKCLESRADAACGELTPRQEKVVAFVYMSLREKGIVIQKDIEEFFNQKGSSTAKMIDRLEEKGYLMREKSEQDMRAKKILLTKKSEEKINEIVNSAKAVEEIMLRGISEEEIIAFRDILGKMTANLNKNIVR